MDLEFICRHCAELVLTVLRIGAAEEELLRAHLRAEHLVADTATMRLGELLTHFDVRPRPHPVGSKRAS